MRFKEFLVEAEVPIKKEWLDKARKAIDNEDSDATDVAWDLDKDFRLVRNKNWFIREVAIKMAEHKDENPYEEMNEGKKELSVFDKHQLKVVKDILKAPDAMVPFMGGNLTKAEAKEIYKKLTGKDYKEVNEASESEKKGLDNWVKDYRAARKHGNVKLAKSIRDNIDKEIKRLGLNRDEVYGPDLDNKYEIKESKEPKGYYVMGKYQSVAWYPAHKKDEAEKHIKQLNYRGGADYKLEPDYGKEPTFDQSVTKYQDERKDESIDPNIIISEKTFRPVKVKDSDIELETWFERDRAHVEIHNKKTDKTIYELWDDDVRQAVEDGFLNPKDWKGSMIEYAKHLGIIKEAIDPKIVGGMRKSMLEEAVEIPADVSVEKLESMFDAAKRALGIANKLKDPAEKKKHLSQVMKGLNKIRNSVMRMMSEKE